MVILWMAIGDFLLMAIYGYYILLVAISGYFILLVAIGALLQNVGAIH